MLACGPLMRRRAPDCRPRGGLVETRLLLLVAALSASLLTFGLAAGNRLSPAGWIVWIASVLLWLAALSDSGTPGREPRSSRVRLRRLGLRKPWRSAAALLAILALAAFFRFHRLDLVPPEMTSDHVEKLLDARDVLEGSRPIYFPRNGGREPIQMYLLAAFAALTRTGLSFAGLKLVSALEGLLVMPAVVVLGRELVDRRTGWVAGFLVAVSWWHTSLSRLGLRIVLTPLVAALLVASLARALRSGERRHFLACGVWLGIGLYAYQALRIAPLLVAAAVGLAMLHRDVTPEARRRLLSGLAAAGVIAFAVATPLTRFALERPDVFWFRVLHRVSSVEAPIDGHSAVVLLQNLRDCLLMFHVRGDASWFAAVPGAPLLDPLTGLLFLAGCGAWLVRMARTRDPVDAVVPLGLFFFLLPSALALAFPIENPSVTRASGVVPLVFTLAAYPVGLLLRVAQQPHRHGARPLLPAVLVAALAAVATLNYRTYFDEYAASYRSRAPNPSELGAVVARFGTSAEALDHVFLQSVPHWHDHRAVAIEAGHPDWDNAIRDVGHLRRLLLVDPRLTDDRPKMFVVHPNDDAAREMLREAYPEGRFTLVESRTSGRDFLTFTVPAGTSE